MNHKKEMKKLKEELEVFDFIRNSKKAKGKIKDALEKAYSLGYRIKRMEELDWLNNILKTSGGLMLICIYNQIQERVMKLVANHNKNKDEVGK